MREGYNDNTAETAVRRADKFFKRGGVSHTKNLKSCPWCGREPKLIFTGKADRKWMVICNFCSVKKGLYGQKNVAIESWNERRNDG